MKRKEALFAVIGGFVGAVLAIAGGAFMPQVTATDDTDARYETIICKEIQVVDANGKNRIMLNDGAISVRGTDGKSNVLILAKDGAQIAIGDGESSAGMEVNDGGGYVFVRGKESGVSMSSQGHKAHGEESPSEKRANQPE